MAAEAQPRRGEEGRSANGDGDRDRGRDTDDDDDLFTKDIALSHGPEKVPAPEPPEPEDEPLVVNPPSVQRPATRSSSGELKRPRKQAIRKQAIDDNKDRQGDGPAMDPMPVPAPLPQPPPQPPPQPTLVGDEAEAFYAALSDEAIAFHVPKRASIDQVFRVSLLVHPGHSEQALAGALAARIQPSPDGPTPTAADIDTRSAKLSDEMQATLTSSSTEVNIVPQGADTQLVRRQVATEWHWDVTAKEGGSHQLTLSLYAIPQGRRSGIKIRTFQETLHVDVPTLVQLQRTVSDHWEWMWTFIAGPTLALLWRQRRRRRELLS